MNKQAEAFLSVYKKAVFVFPVLGAAAGICYFLAMRNDFEANIGHFARGSVTAGAAAALCIVSVLLSAVLAFCSRKKLMPAKVPDRDPLLVTASILGVVGAAGVLFLLAMPFLDPLFGTAAKGRLQLFADLASVLLIPALILTLMQDFKVSDARAFFWIGSAAAVILSLFACYFDFDDPLNSPVRVFTMLMQASVLLLTLAESRLALDPDAKRTYCTAPFQIFACGTVSSVGLGVSLGGLLFALFGADYMDPMLADPNLPAFRLLLYFGLALFGLSRLFALPKIAGPYRPPLLESPVEGKQTGRNDNE